MALIIQQADVSASTFQNIFRNKEGVLMELTQTMFEKQFSMASGVMGEAMPPDAKSWAFVASKRTPWRTEKTEAEADLLNFAIKRNLKRLED